MGRFFVSLLQLFFFGVNSIFSPRRCTTYFDNDTSIPRNYEYQQYSLNLNAIGEADCIQGFRFRRNQLLVLIQHMGLQDTVRTKERKKFSGIEGLCILLERLAYSVRLYTLATKYGRSYMVCSSHDITMYRLEETIREDGCFERKLIYGDPPY